MQSTPSSWSDHDISYPQYDAAVVIGRFQPFHNGHVRLIEEAKKYSKNIIVLVGSSHIAPNTKNPFPYQLRDKMIRSVFPDVLVASVTDDLYNDQQWIAQVHAAVQRLTAANNISSNRICLVGHKKDQSSWYLDAFPKWDYKSVEPVANCDGTEIRTTLFGIRAFSKDIPSAVKTVLKDWSTNCFDEFERLVDEYHFLKKYRQQFSSLPYPPIFVTTDSVVINNGFILLVKRGAHPGKGLWALPGGFVNADERIQDGMIRELREETRISINDLSLKAALRGTHVFDAPGRSLRGRTITHAGLFVLNEQDLPKVRGSDDAEKAKWIPISDFYSLGMKEQMYEDHWSIASYMINRAG